MLVMVAAAAVVGGGGRGGVLKASAHNYSDSAVRAICNISLS